MESIHYLRYNIVQHDVNVLCVDNVIKKQQKQQQFNIVYLQQHNDKTLALFCFVLRTATHRAIYDIYTRRTHA